MNHATLLTLALFFIGSILTAQEVSFLHHQTINDDVAGTHYLAMGDIDNDGDLDLVSAGDLILWYENDEGQFMNPQTIADPPAAINGLVLEDVDGDDLPDILVVNGLFETISIYANSGSAPYYNLPVVEVDSIQGARFDLLDVNDDGLPELVYSDAYGARVSMLHNEGSLQFAGRVTVFESGFVADLHALDIDDDGFEDLVVARLNGLFYSVINDQNGDFEVPQPFAQMNGVPTSIISADIDGDNLLDLTASTDVGGIKLFANDGDDSFLSGSVIETGSTAYPYQAASSDLDGDGDPDLIYTLNGTHTVGWYENESGAFGSMEIIHEAEDTYPSDVLAADFDSDGDEDLVVHLRGTGSIEYYKNDRINTIAMPAAVVHLTLYPNPASDKIRLSGMRARGEVIIFSILGEQVMRTSLSEGEEMDISDLAPGLYIISLDQGATKHQERFVKR